MKTVQTILFALLLSGCANAQSTVVSKKLDLTGEPLPSIRHITEMKVSGDTLLFVYESEDGHGQRFLRRAVIDSDRNELKVGPDIGKREDGYYASYMPYPFLDDNGNIRVVSQDDCELYAVQNDTVLVRQNKYLMGSNCRVPFPLSQYVQDVFMTAPEKYVFIGREPNGGRQYAMTADLSLAKIDTIRQINISTELQPWMPNAGELAYSSKHNRLAFAYRLHPVIEIFGFDDTIIKTVKVADLTFNSSTLEEADFESLNPIHFADINTNDNYIYALCWGHRYGKSGTSTIFQLDWEGNIVNRKTKGNSISKIAVCGDGKLIAWDGKEMRLIEFD